MIVSAYYKAKIAAACLTLEVAHAQSLIYLESAAGELMEVGILWWRIGMVLGALQHPGDGWLKAA